MDIRFLLSASLKVKHCHWWSDHVTRRCFLDFLQRGFFFLWFIFFDDSSWNLFPRRDCFLLFPQAHLWVINLNRHWSFQVTCSVWACFSFLLLLFCLFDSLKPNLELYVMISYEFLSEHFGLGESFQILTQITKGPSKTGYCL